MAETTDAGNSADITDIEQRVLRWSLLATSALSIVGIVWGIAASSQVIVFDGVYGFTGIVLTWLSMTASKLIKAGPSDRYPFGRESLAPMVIAIQGLVLLGVCAFAMVEAVMVIVDGGSDVSADSAVIYAVSTGALVIGMWLVIRRYAHHSDLLAVEATQWLAASALTAAMIIGFGAAMIVNRGSYANAGRYVDPVLMFIAAIALIPTPLRLIRTTILELLEGAPPTEVIKPVEHAIAELCAEFSLDEPRLRMTKLGRKLYVDVTFLVDSSEWDLVGEDRVRRSLRSRIDHMPYDLWMTVELSSDPEWVR